MKPGDNIALIGMPGAGKSTIGVLLAKRAAMDFVDTDLLIQRDQGVPLQQTLDAHGYLGLRAIEERILLGLRGANRVIATGGSAAYSAAAMAHLKTMGPVVFLDVPFDVIVGRVQDLDTRGIACRPGMSFEGLFEERRPLYLRYADVRIDCGRHGQDAICAELVRTLRIAAPL